MTPSSRWAKYQYSELSPEQTAAVEEAVDDARLTTFLEKHPLQRLDFTNQRTGDYALDSASGWTIPPTAKVKGVSYPWINVKPIFRLDRLSLGNEPLRPGFSPVVAVVDSTIGFMKCVLAHELGHHIIFERPDLMSAIKADFQHGIPISDYASLNSEEYFCETLAAYTYYQNDLLKYDKIGYNLVRDILKALEGTP